MGLFNETDDRVALLRQKIEDSSMLAPFEVEEVQDIINKVFGKTEERLEK